MRFGIPQTIYIALIFMSIGITMAKNGQPRGNYNIANVLVASIIELTLLYFGGFFG